MLYIENSVLGAICCRLNCCSYVLTRIRFLPRSTNSFLANVLPELISTAIDVITRGRRPRPGRLIPRAAASIQSSCLGPVPRLFPVCGSDDRLFSTMRDLHEKLTDLSIPHAWSTVPGGHSWKYRSSVLPIMFKFHLAVREQNSGIKP